MKVEIVKNNTVYCSCYTHPFEEGQLHSCYCRAANQVLETDSLFCDDCPLMIYDAEQKRCFGCLYFDTERSKAESDESRIKIAIHNGLLPEFPYYLEDDKNHLVEMALQYAAEAHKGATRKGVNVPYIVHAVETAGIVSRMTKNRETIAAAALHDVLEDTDTTAEELENVFGRVVVELVQYQTENKRKHLPAETTWEIRKQEALEHYKNAPLEAKKIALADKLSNMRASARDYQCLKDEMWNKFNQKDKKKQEWYYRSLLISLEELKDTKVYQEYEKLVDFVFL